MYVEQVKKVILETKKEYSLPVYDFEFDNIDKIPHENLQFQISDQLFFEMLLLKIRGKTISYGYAIYKKKMEIQKEADLIKQIEQLEGEAGLKCIFTTPT